MYMHRLFPQFVRLIPQRFLSKLPRISRAKNQRVSAMHYWLLHMFCPERCACSILFQSLSPVAQIPKTVFFGKIRRAIISLIFYLSFEFFSLFCTEIYATNNWFRFSTHRNICTRVSQLNCIKINIRNSGIYKRSDGTLDSEDILCINTNLYSKCFNITCTVMRWTRSFEYSSTDKI